MADRYFGRTLPCGCMISSDGGGGVMPCSYGYGCGKKFNLNGKVVKCDEHHECPECIKQNRLCQKSWAEWRASPDHKIYEKECWENNNDTPYEEPDELTELVKEKISKIEGKEDERERH